MMADENPPSAHLLALERSDMATAERLHAACPSLIWQSPGGVGADDQTGEHAVTWPDSACVIVGRLDAIVHALAPTLIAQTMEQAWPVIAVASDGTSVVALAGAARGADPLARQMAAALGVRAVALERAVPAPAADVAPGRLTVVGIGPGDRSLMAPEAMQALACAEDIIGYETYVRMAGPWRADQVVHASANRRELDRARLAFELAASGRRVAVVSSGDPGIFAMASAVFEALDQAADPAWRQVDVAVLPGISAAQAAAARSGAPLGHDFCVISLSDNLKPWPEIERRLIRAVTADFVIALYNPGSLARPTQFGEALALLRHHRSADVPVVLGRDIGRPDEQVVITTLGAVRADQADMRTVVLIGSSQTRRIERPDGGCWVYTPRWYPEVTYSEEMGRSIPPAP